MRSCALAHSVDFKHWDVQTHKVFKCFLGNWRRSCKAKFAPIQPQSSTHFLEDQIIGYSKAPGYGGVTEKEKYQITVI